MGDIIETGQKAAEFGKRLDEFIELGKSAMKVGGIVAVNALAEKFFPKKAEADQAVDAVKEETTPEVKSSIMDAAKEDAVKDALMLNEDTDEITGKPETNEVDDGKEEV